MENLKIRVNSYSEIEEAEKILLELGFSRVATAHSEKQSGMVFSDGHVETHLHKSITLDQLRQMVNPMKEYLDTAKNYTYVQDTAKRSEDWIEIPEGANFYMQNTMSEEFSFHKDLIRNDFLLVLWQRPTQPEELPFIDDEPLQSLNNQYAEIEKVRQSQRTASETSNPTIKETLNQRQSQYGSFEDVAQTTEQLFQVIKGGASFVDFTESQRMALYMIFSKVARLSNGDCNHKDSWHDIAGYATLIDSELVSEKDMPF